MYVDVLAVRRACKQGPESGLRGPDSAFCCAFMKVAQTWDSGARSPESGGRANGANEWHPGARSSRFERFLSMWMMTDYDALWMTCARARERS